MFINDRTNLQNNNHIATDNVNGNPTDRFQYNGKERVLDLNLYEYGFRWYDPQTARFIQVDPLAMQYPFKTTYDYAENEPVRNIDLDGLEKFTPNGNGTFTVTRETDNPNASNPPLLKTPFKTMDRYNFPQASIGPARGGQRANTNSSNSFSPNLLSSTTTKTETGPSGLAGIAGLVNDKAGEVDFAATHMGPLANISELSTNPTNGFKYKVLGELADKVGTSADVYQLVYSVTQKDVSGMMSSGADLFFENPRLTQRVLGLSEAGATRLSWGYYLAFKVGYDVFVDSDWAKRNSANGFYQEYTYYTTQSRNYYNNGNYDQAREYRGRANRMYQLHKDNVGKIGN